MSAQHSKFSEAHGFWLVLGGTRASQESLYLWSATVNCLVVHFGFDSRVCTLQWQLPKRGECPVWHRDGGFGVS